MLSANALDQCRPSGGFPAFFQERFCTLEIVMESISNPGVNKLFSDVKT